MASEVKEDGDTATEISPTRPLGTVVGVVIALLGVPVIAFIAHWYTTYVMGDSYRAEPIMNALAPLVLFMVLLVLALLNPLLRRWLPSCSMGSADVFMVASVWLLAGVICHKFMVQPVLHAIGDVEFLAESQANVKRSGMAEHLPAELLLTNDQSREYTYGLGDGSAYVPVSSVPWSAWSGPLLRWLPLMVFAGLLTWSMVRMMHRQWSRHELLSYPIAEFSRSVFALEPGKSFPTLFYSKVFWYGASVSLFIFILNGLSAWYPLVVAVPLEYRFTEVIENFPFLERYCGREAYSLFRGMFYLFVIALAVLLPSEISLSCWVTWVAMIYLTGFHFLITGEVLTKSGTTAMQTGMFVATVALVLFIGRREYAAVLRHALRPKPSEDPAMRQAARACRWFLISAAGLVFLLSSWGLDWLLALALVASFAMVMLVAARLTAEVGFPWLPDFGGLAVGLPLKFLGAAAIGPQGLALIAIFSVIFGINAQNSVAAQATTIGRLEDDQPTGRTVRSAVMAIGCVVALVSAIGVGLWHSYSFGGRQETTISRQVRGQMESAASRIGRLDSAGSAMPTTATERLAAVQAEPTFWTYFVLGFAIFVAVAVMRQRFIWWPLHPLPLVLLDTWALSRLYVSFFVAWLIKTLIVRIWGGRVFQQAKPFFLGVVAGQVLVFGLWLIIGAIYYVQTGIRPPLIGSFL